MDASGSSLAVSARNEQGLRFAGLAAVTLREGAYHLQWDPAAGGAASTSSITYDVFESQRPGAARYDFRRPILSGVGRTSVEVGNLDVSRRHYFIVRARDAHGHADANCIEQTDRVVRLSGQPNFRDLGGYVNADGVQVRWGMVYRSGDLSSLTEDDLTKVEMLGLARVLDLRKDWEVSNQPDKLYRGNETKYDFLPFTDEPHLDGTTDWLAVDPRVFDGHNVYVNMVRRNGRFIRHAFERFADPEHYPVLEHCTAGKDRTGAVAALLLMLLGVPRATIIEDYVLTGELIDVQALIARWENLLRTNKSVPAGVTLEDWMPVLGCPVEAIERLIDWTDREYGGIGGFLTSIGVAPETQAAVRRILLADGARSVSSV